MTDTFALGMHADWRCQHSGACCSSGWPIPVDALRRARIGDALRDGTLVGAPVGAAARDPFVAADDTSTTGADAETPLTLLAVTPGGHCVFHDEEARRCGVQRALGHDALPLACRMFPRVCLSDARGVRISLSHYCPSAAARLFDEDGDASGGEGEGAREDARRLRIVRAPAAFPAQGEYDGLDAREAFPPLLRPGVLLDWETADALERFGVDRFADRAASPEAALDRFAALCEALRVWRAADGPLLAHFHALTQPAAAADGAGAAVAPRTGARIAGGAGAEDRSPADADLDATAAADAEADANDERRTRHGEDGDAWAWTLALDASVRACVPDGVACASVPAGAGAAYGRWVAPVWPAMARPVSRYLAARLFGAWCWYQGQGLRSLVRSLDAALAVLRVEAARQTMASGRMLDRNQMREAIRQADLLGLHLASRDALAARWSAAEREGLRP